jgi:hypothetical protein
MNAAFIIRGGSRDDMQRTGQDALRIYGGSQHGHDREKLSKIPQHSNHILLPQE